MRKTATLTPFNQGESRQIGRQTFRKQVLPLRTINYKGRQITFDRQYLADLAESFNGGAYDQVPLVFADNENRHHENPEAFRGEITGFELADDGLDAIISATPEGVKLLKDNPKLGVSARIMEGVTKDDGRTFPRAIRHVLATMFPRVSGMRPWQAVDLAEDADIEEVVDLTAEQFQEEADMGKPKTATIDVSRLTDEQFRQMLDLAEAAGVGENGDELTPEELEALEAEANGDGDDEDEVDENGDPVVKATPPTKTTETKTTKTTEPAGAPASADLSDTFVHDTNDRFRQIEIRGARDRWVNERARFIDAGVPPFLVDLAEPVLSSPDTLTIDLSDDDGKPVKHDATATVRKMLEGMKHIVDFSPELGHGVDLSDIGGDNDPDKILMDQWDQGYGK